MKVADKAGTQSAITNWTTPKKGEGGMGKDQVSDDEQQDEREEDGSMMEDSSSSSEVELIDKEKGKGRRTERKEDIMEEEEGGEDEQAEDDVSMGGSTYEDANENEQQGEERTDGGSETVASVLGLTSKQATPRAGSTPKASFQEGTNFSQKKLPGSQVRRSNKPPANPYMKHAVDPVPRSKQQYEHDYHTYIRVQINLKGEADPPSAIQRILGDFLTILQKKDPNACFTKELNVRRQIYEVADFPSDFREFYDNWSHWEHDAGYFLLPAPLGGNGRAYHGTLCLSSDWEGERLLEQCIFSVRSIQSKGGTIRASIKELQVMRTSRNLILFGVPSNVHFAAVNNLLRDVMDAALHSMVQQNPVRYPEDEYQSPPDFSVVRMYVKNTPFEKRDKNDTTPSWARLPLHFEVDVLLEDYLEEILKEMVSSHLIHHVFGDYVWILKNSPPNRASEDDKQTMKTALRTHMAIVLSLGRVFLRGLEHPDHVIKLQRGVGEDGIEKRPVEMTTRKLMMLIKVNGIRLWQFICPTSDGGWCGYYSSGKMCDAHRSLADAWSGAAAAHVRFKCVSRGIIPRDISKFLRASFSLAACREGEKARYVNGAIVSEQHASMLEIGNKIKHCKWVDNTAFMAKGPGKSAEQEHTTACLDDDSMAFTFAAHESIGEDTAAHSLINPETGETWKDGEKEQHLRGAIEGARRLEREKEDDASIASGESAGWDQQAVFEFEGMPNDEPNDEGRFELDGMDDNGRNGGDNRSRDLGKELHEALLASGRLGSGEDQPLGQDINDDDE